MSCEACDTRCRYMAADPEMYRGDDRRCDVHQKIASQAKRIEELESLRPSLERRGGRRMADAINILVRRGILDARSRATDTSLDWADPDFKRMDEIESLQAQTKLQAQRLDAISRLKQYESIPGPDEAFRDPGPWVRWTELEPILTPPAIDAAKEVKDG